MSMQALRKASRAAGFALVSDEDAFDVKVAMYPHLLLSHDPKATETEKAEEPRTVMYRSRPRANLRITDYLNWRLTSSA